jgi:hypothetical protein
LSLFAFVVLSFSGYAFFLGWSSTLFEKDVVITKESTYTPPKRDIQMVSVPKMELSTFLKDNIFYLHLNDSLFKLMEEDIGDKRKYVYTLKEMATLCPYATYPDNREYIPEDLNKKLTHIEELNKQFCDLMIESGDSMLSLYESDDTEEILRDYSKARALNTEAYEIRLLIEEIGNEILSITE